MSKNDGGPAFPVVDLVGAGLRSIDVNPTTGAPSGAGMSLRDYAAINLPGLDVKFEGLEHAAKSLGLTAPAEDDMPGILQFAFEIEAKMRYMLADAMLAERGK